MRPENDGIYLRSRSFTYGLGQNIVFDLAFLNKALKWHAPEIADFDILFTGTVGAVTGGALGRDAAKLYDKILINDGAPLVDASGAALRVVQQAEFGNKQTDPGDIASGSTNSTYEYLLKVCFEPVKSVKLGGRDTRMPLINLLEAGQIVINTAAAVPTGWAAVQSDWTVQVFCRVVEGRIRQANSRLRIWEQQVTQREFDYDIGGNLRYAGLTSKLATTGYTSLAGFTSLNSKTLDWDPNWHPRMLRERYRRFADSLGTNDEHTLATPGAIPLVTPDRFQRIGAMPDLAKLHLDLGAAAPTSGVLVCAAVVDREIHQAARALGYDDVNQYAADFNQYGRVMDGREGGSPVKNYQNALQRRLPVRIALESRH